MENSNNGETALLSEFILLLTYVKDELDYHEDELPKKLLEECRMKFSDHTVNLLL